MLVIRFNLILSVIMARSAPGTTLPVRLGLDLRHGCVRSSPG
nr:MAG TPA_asm: hypothetical protein [Bacteriophage sp.]